MNLAGKDVTIYECGCSEWIGIEDNNLVQRVSFCDDHIGDAGAKRDLRNSFERFALRQIFRPHQVAQMGIMMPGQGMRVLVISHEQVQGLPEDDDVAAAESKKAPPAATL
jgi:hypothetical protein